MPEKRTSSQLVPLPLGHKYSSGDFVEGMRSRDARIMSAFFDTYQEKINGLVWRLLGADVDHNDVVNTVFLNILSSIWSLKDPQALSKWVSTITVNTVRREIRRRKYKRLFSVTTDSPEDYHTAKVSRITGDVKGRVYKILRTMKADSHIVFVLRYIDGRTFEEIAELRGCSLATAKRHGKKCHQEFLKKAQKDSLLAGYIEEGADVG